MNYINIHYTISVALRFIRLWTFTVICTFGLLYSIDGKIENGEKIYSIYCSACHGHSGDGNGPAAVNMYPPPRDFTTGVFKYRSTPIGSLPTDDDLVQVIRQGVPQSWMPPWDGLLTESQIHDVISYIKLFFHSQRNWGIREPLPSLNSVQPPQTANMIILGEVLYLLMECGTCHGISGQGDGPSSKTLLDYKGRKIKPADLTRDNYRTGVSGANIRRTLLTGLYGTPMPSYADLFIIPREELDELENRIKDRKIVNNFVNQLPTYEDLKKLNEKELTSLSYYYEWALVYYVQSLVRENTWFDWLLRVNPDEVPKKY